jgi:hypothetical protein
LETHKFSLPDRAGSPQSYTVTEHDPDRGFVLSCQIGSLVSGPALMAFYELVRTGDARTALAVVAASFAASDEENPPTADAMRQREAIMAKIQPDRIVTAIRESLNSVPPELARALLEQTSRNGKPLSDPDVYREAYARNYGELRAALWEVVAYNGFFSLQDILDASSRA